MIAAARAATSSSFLDSLGAKTAAANTLFTNRISNDKPYTPNRVAMRVRGKFPDCAYPSSSHGKEVTRLRANSTATQIKGAAGSARRMGAPGLPILEVPRLEPAATANKKPNRP